MLWKLSLAVAAVLCAGGVCRCVRADLMSQLMAPRAYGVKLCGREFIRAVIFTCGGSRWRRSIQEEPDSLPWSSLSDATADGDRLGWRSSSTELGERHLLSSSSSSSSSSSQSLSDLLALYGETSPLQSSQTALASADQAGRPAAAAAGSWSAEQSKTKRNFSLGVAGICCTQGCTKNDIGRLC